MINLNDYVIYIYIISILLTITSIIINACILARLRKLGGTNVTTALKEGGELAEKVLKALNLNNITDVIEFVKNLASGKIELPQNAQELNNQIDYWKRQYAILSADVEKYTKQDNEDKTAVLNALKLLEPYIKSMANNSSTVNSVNDIILK